MRVAASDFQQGDIAFCEIGVVMFDEIRYQHAFRRAFYQDDCVGKEQVTVCGTQIADGKFCGVRFITKSGGKER